MIYKNNYFKKELRGAFLDRKINIKNMLLYAFFISLLTFVIHMVLKTLQNTVLSDLFPQIMSPSFFAVAFLYTFFAFIFFIVYFIHYYRYFTFTEIHQNQWYVLMKHGYRAERMIGAKIAARMLFIVIVYSAGYILSLLFTLLLGYKSFNILNIISLYFAGLLDILFAALCIMAISLFTDKPKFLKLFSVFIIVILYALQFATDYNSVLGNWVLMKDITKLILTPYFLTVLASACLISVLIVLTARDLASYYFPSPIREKNILTRDFKTDAYTVKYKKRTNSTKVIKIISNTVMGLFVTVCLCFNVLMLVITISNTTAKVLFGNRVPVVYEYDVMTPTIHKNDIALFIQVTPDTEFQEGDVVMFRTASGEIEIRKIFKIENDTFTVNYMTTQSTENTLINRDQIMGLHTGNNRVLGAFLVFTNSFAGRVIMLVIPVIWLFFGDYIVAKVTKKNIKQTLTQADGEGSAECISKDEIDLSNLIVEGEDECLTVEPSGNISEDFVDYDKFVPKQ